MSSKILWNSLTIASGLFGAVLLGTAAIAQEASIIPNATTEPSLTTSVETVTTEATTETTVADSTINDLTQIDEYSVEALSVESFGDLSQVTSVSQLSDVQPTDWAFQALQNLVERYGCIAGYPDGTYRGQRALTRFEFAAGMNACLDRINELIAAGLAEAVTREDLATLQRLQEEFAAELATIRGQVDALEARTAELEANQFSTTTKLVGETIFAVSDIFGGAADNDANNEIGEPGVDESNNTVFQSRVRLNFDTSFVGTDRLRARVQAGNFNRFNGDPSAGETRLGFDTGTGNTFQLDDLNYQFNLGDRTRVGIFANGADLRDIVLENVISPFVPSGRGAVSRFGRFNPIYRVANSSAGASLTYRFTNPVLTTDILSVQVGYGAGENANPGTGSGLFNGDYGIIAQLVGRSFLGGNLDWALTYVNSYTGTRVEDDGSITAGIRSTGVGSRLARVDVDRPVSVNSYGVQLNYRLNPGFQIGGWAGYSFVRALELGDAEVFNFAATLAFPDLGGAGNLGGIVFGMQPRLVDADAILGDEEDLDTGFHVEGFYRFALTENIDITPGIIWLTAPNHNEDNDDIFVGVLRTTFRF